MRKILIVDDDQGIINVLKEEIGRTFDDVHCESELSFARAVQRVADERPDVVVLDLLENSAVSDPPGQAAWESIWTRRFCPVIVYTAYSGELTPPIPATHPFVKLVNKGSGSQAQVIAHLRTFRPLVAALTQLHLEIDSVIQRVLRDTAGAAAIPGTEPAHLIHAARRRVAAFMDEKTHTEGRPLFSWEQYLIPPFGGDPLTGDVLRLHGEDWNSAEAYRVVLSPSCDLVRGRHESTVLVARCTSIAAMTAKMSLPSKGRDAIKRLMSQALAPGYWMGFLPLPEFPGRIPHLAALLKRLEVIPYESIGAPTAAPAGYDRIASIDSPFREQVAWAFMNTIGRPGMPDRDIESWATNIIAVGASPGSIVESEKGTRGA